MLKCVEVRWFGISVGQTLLQSFLANLRVQRDGGSQTSGGTGDTG
jgi:hypothetical protein